jgi:glucuronate isomerase
MKTIYPDNYTEEDKAMYDDMMMKGEALIGKKINKMDAFLIDLASRMTINQMKGISSDLSIEEMEGVRMTHKNAMSQLVHETPDNLWEGKEHPLNKTISDYYKDNIEKPEILDVQHL